MTREEAIAIERVVNCLEEDAANGAADGSAKTQAFLEGKAAGARAVRNVLDPVAALAAPPAPQEDAEATVAPCPFCGAPASVDASGRYCWVVCSSYNCAAEGPAGDDSAEATTKWNAVARRLRSPAPQATGTPESHICDRYLYVAKRGATPDEDQLACALCEVQGSRSPAPEGAGTDLVGKIGICSKGRLGLIEGRKALPWGESWIGTGVFDGQPWASREPRILCNADAAALPPAPTQREDPGAAGSDNLDALADRLVRAASKRGTMMAWHFARTLVGDLWPPAPTVPAQAEAQREDEGQT